MKEPSGLEVIANLFLFFVGLFVVSAIVGYTIDHVLWEWGLML